jgi:hypothetical protein
LCLREYEALATLTHIYLGSFFMVPKDITGLSLGHIARGFVKTAGHSVVRVQRCRKVKSNAVFRGVVSGVFSGILC